ncbi:MAG: hypothetical protein HKN25_03540, partial [Pyrinomonadaceae bacterium]|nr:hypothetical protein [Pyrinomonadaceae bacterium]
MKAEDFQQIKRIFQSAVELTPENRSAFLNKECGENGDLRREVERLLDAKDSEFMEEPAMAYVAEEIVEEEVENESTKIFGNFENRDQFGNYKIISKIGKGGMGEVYLAKDKSLDRKVAIKFLSNEFS